MILMVCPNIEIIQNIKHAYVYVICICITINAIIQKGFAAFDGTIRLETLFYTPIYNLWSAFSAGRGTSNQVELASTASNSACIYSIPSMRIINGLVIKSWFIKRGHEENEVFRGKRKRSLRSGKRINKICLFNIEMKWENGLIQNDITDHFYFYFSKTISLSYSFKPKG